MSLRVLIVIALYYSVIASVARQSQLAIGFKLGDCFVVPPRNDKKQIPPRNDKKQEPHCNDNKQATPRNDNKQEPPRNDNKKAPPSNDNKQVHVRNNVNYPIL